MKTFRQYLMEENEPFTAQQSGEINITDPSVIDNINMLLNRVTANSTVTPYITLEKIRKVLSYFHIHLPKSRR